MYVLNIHCEYECADIFVQENRGNDVLREIMKSLAIPWTFEWPIGVIFLRCTYNATCFGIHH